MKKILAFMVALVVIGVAEAARSADSSGLKQGAPDLMSAGPLAFAPGGILLVGDTKAAAIFAIDTGDKTGDPKKVEIKIEGLQQKLADLLASSAPQIQVNDMAVNPASGNVYLSVSYGTSPASAIVKIDSANKITKLDLAKIGFSKAVLPNAPEDKVVGEGRRQANRRNESITDLAYVNGQVIVSGLSSAAAPSTVRALAFPFVDADPGMSLEIYHGAHGKLEDYAPIRTFVPMTINGEATILAGFTCTPLVRIPLSSITAGKKTRGTTVAELGNRNKPLDMIHYEKDGKEYLLMANSARGVMKISTENIDRKEGIENPVKSEREGQAYETIESLKGTVQLDRLNDKNAIVIIQVEGGPMDIRTVPLP